MSSFIAHSLVGFAVGEQRGTGSTLKESIFISLFFIFLACSPDIDYLIAYLRGEGMSMRYTHSVGFVFLVSLLALFFRNFVFRKTLYSIPVFLFFLAPLSHLTLDFFVGVYASPYLYPFSSSTFTSPLGVLPSAGRINIHNFYFWRNTLIELAIFIPVVVFWVPKFRRYILKYRAVTLLLISLFLVGIVIGVGLER